MKGLRDRLDAIERPRLATAVPGKNRHSPSSAALWTLGAAGVGRRFGLVNPSETGALTLDPAACHEVKPGSESAGSHAAAIAFALALAGRRLATEGDTRRGLLWCATSQALAEHGRPYGPGLRRFGIDPASLVLVETRTLAETLSVLEETLRSKAFAVAMALASAVDLTPARRLSLAARDGDTACLLVSRGSAPPTAATATRWRIGPSPSPPHPFDPRAPGAARFAVRLERCRAAPAAGEAPFILEWCDETYAFRVAAALADRTLAPPDARRAAR